EGCERALEPALPAVRPREGLGRRRLLGRERRQRAQPLALGRRIFEVPGELRQRAATRPAPHLLGVERRLHLVPERTGLAGTAVVRRRLAHEVQTLERAGAGGVEE